MSAGTTWDLLAEALARRRPVRARYRGTERLLCPHLLGHKNGRAKVLCYQSGGATSQGRLPKEPSQCWRSLFVDDLEDAKIVNGGFWATADNYSLNTNCVDKVEICVAPVNHS